ncbi:integrase core domain-containing protein [uncultured Slackia sp.]|uniref:integrase core domain-containing protein n=1 Tax=uncultured Slackia sp. TaxID=665903 RepID=UPI0026DF7434|nr:integrase core domain-containing protein [uncultured Slackia sp.]
MTDNGPGYRSGEFNALLESEGSRHIYTRPFSPWQNGKVEQMNRTLAQEWQYARAYGSDAGRADAPRPSSSTVIGSPRTARAGACRPCRASSA